MITLSVLSPFIAFLLAGLTVLYSPALKEKDNNDAFAVGITIVGMVLSLVGSLSVAYTTFVHHINSTVHVFTWINSGTLNVSWELHFDKLTGIMLVLVSTVSLLVHIYSVGYMSHDPSRKRFMAYLSLFTFFMLTLVTSANILQLFFGWEGVGVSSYLLIGFWFKKNSANNASIKAFVVNRCGDFFFTLGIALIFVYFHTLNMKEIFANVYKLVNVQTVIFGGHINVITLICLCLFGGAMAKSAQIGLHTWLADAMEGPTPVSALIHAATMVTAGVFMVARLSPIFERSQTILNLIVIVGSLTAFLGATVAVTQYDIKKIIAYSTMSQLGYMFASLGVSAYGVGVYHLFTHGFFKALLFLCAGCVIHAVSDEQDIRKMGGLRKYLPITYIFMWVGNLALAGIPPLAGYFSKDKILEVLWASGSWVGHFGYVLGTAAAFLTAFYSWRLIFMVFHGESKLSDEEKSHVHEASPIMWGPLVPLVLGAICLGYISTNLVGENYNDFWKHSIFTLPSHTVMADVEKIPLMIKTLPSILAVLGIILAFFLYGRKSDTPEKLKKKMPALFNLLSNKYYIDEIYEVIFTNNVFVFGQFLKVTIEDFILEHVLIVRLTDFVSSLSKMLRITQSGLINHYAFVMCFGLVAIVSWLLIQGGL